MLPLDNRWRYLNRFDWNRAVILYDTPAFQSTVGHDGGYLLAATIHFNMINLGVDVFGWELQSVQTYEEMLLQVVGNNYASESSLKGTGSLGLWRHKYGNFSTNYTFLHVWL